MPLFCCRRFFKPFLTVELWFYNRKIVPEISPAFMPLYGKLPWRSRLRLSVLLHSLSFRHSLKLLKPYEKLHKLISCYFVNKDNCLSTAVLDLDDGSICTIVDDICPTKTVLVENKGLLYISMDKNDIPNQVWYRQFSSRGSTISHDKLLLQTNSSKKSMLNVSLSRDKQYILITTSTRLSSEVYILPTSAVMSSCKPSTVINKAKGTQYYLDHAHERFYMIVNNGSKGQFRILASTVAGNNFNSSLNWKEFCSSEENFILHDVEFFHNYVVLYGNTANLKPVIKLITCGRLPQVQSVVFENYTHIDKHPQSYHSNDCKIHVSSPISPPVAYTISSEKNLSPPVPSGNGLYTISRESARAKDGADVPITLVHARNIKNNGLNPVLAFVYGAHGVPLFMGYRESVLYLIKRGWIIAYCHVRGGNELGPDWFYKATGKMKHVTHEDLHSCLVYLHDVGYSSPSKTALFGKSSGALVAGNLCNRWPQLIEAAILEMPFLNLYHTLSRANAFIDCLDKEEFGDPDLSIENERLIKSLCPYWNLLPQDYPSFLVLASKSDELIRIAHVDEYVSKLKSCIKKHHCRKEHVDQNTTYSCKLSRGRVIYRTFPSATHYESTFNSNFRRKQEALKITFLLEAITSKID